MQGIDFIKKSILLWIGNIFVSALGFLIFFILTNYLSPADYGIYALVMGMLSFLSLSFYSITNDAISRFSPEHKRIALLHGFQLQFITGIFLFLILFIFADFIALIYRSPIALLIRISSVIFLFTPLIESIKSFHLGEKFVHKFIITNSLYPIIIIMTLLIFRIKLNLLFTVIIYSFSNLFVFLILSYKYNLLKLFKSKKGKLVNRMNLYIKNGFIFGLTKNIFFQGPLIIGAYFVGNSSLAYYAFGFSIGVQGIFTFINSLQLILVPYLVGTKDKIKLSQYISAIIKFGFVISVIFAFFILLFLHFLLPILFPKYVIAYKYIALILFAFTFLNLRTPQVIFNLTENTKLLTKISIISALFSIIVTIFMAYLFGLIGMILALMINILFYGYIHIYYLKKDGIYVSLLPSKNDFFIIRQYFLLFLKKFKNYLKN